MESIVHVYKMLVVQYIATGNHNQRTACGEVKVPPFVGVLGELFCEETSGDVNWTSGIGVAYVRTFMNRGNVNPFNTIRYITLLSCLF